MQDWGSHGIILHTENGGDTWEEQLDVQRDLHDVYFSDDQTGYAVGDSGAFFKTNDGGNIWEDRSIDKNYFIRGASFLDANKGWIACHDRSVGTAYAILNTDDGGNTWNNQSSWTGRTLSDIHFVNRNSGWAVGETWHGTGLIINTNDGGSTWLLQTDSIPAPLTSVHFITSNMGWTIGENGLIFFTADGGATWQSEQSGTSYDLNGVYFSDEGYGWTVGDEGTILGGDYSEVVTVEEFRVSGLESRVWCYPNPFSTLTIIEYELEKAGNIHLTIFNQLGKQVFEFNEYQPKGLQRLYWKVGELPAGIYFCVLKTDSGMQTLKMIKMK